MQPGIRLGDRYAVTELLGTGAHTGVWSAHDPVRDRPVRVKALDPALSADAATRLRFRHSTLEVAALDLPGVVKVLECVDHHDGDALTVCQITEPVAGVPLDRMLREGLDLGCEDILSLIATAAWAVDDAHEAGVRHLNLKPSNLFIADGTVTIADFGYLPVPDIGPYTAVEQRDGAAAGRTADVYALGAIAYECLTGAAPTGADPAATLPAGTPGAVSSLLERALAHDPQLRFASAGALATECELINHTNDVLGALLDRTHAEPLTAPPDSGATPAPGPAPESAVAPRPAIHRSAAPPTHAARPHRKRLAVLAGVALAVAVGVVVAISALTPQGSSTSAADDGGAKDPGYVEPSKTESSAMSSSPSPSGQFEDDPVSGPGPTGSSGSKDSGSATPLKPDEPDSPRPPAKIEVPDVVGDSRADATGELEDAGFKVKVTRTGEGEFECPVHEQDPNAGTSVAKGSTVTVTVRLAGTEAECQSGGDGGGQTSPSSFRVEALNPAVLRLG